MKDQDKNNRATLLVVDDESLVRWSLREHLSSRFKVVLASRAEEALAVIQDREDIDLLITDIKMDAMDGITLIEEARQLRPELRVMIMTAYNSEENIGRAHRAGVQMIVSKPFAVDAFETAVLAALNGQGRKKEQA